jgi:hypothetical protein
MLSSMDGFTVSGIGLEGVGVLVAVYGLHATYREFAPPDAREWDPLGDTARSRARTALREFRLIAGRLLRRPPRIETHAGVAHATGGGSIRARGHIGYGPLPSGIEASIAELEGRTRQLLGKVSALEEARYDESARHEADMSAIRVSLEADVSDLREKIRRLATGDVTLQYVGLGMVGVGLVLQAIGAYLSPG